MGKNINDLVGNALKNVGEEAIQIVKPKMIEEQKTKINSDKKKK